MVELDENAIVKAFRHYIGAQEFSFPELALNLRAKLDDRDFRDDLTQLVVDLPVGVTTRPWLPTWLCPD